MDVKPKILVTDDVLANRVALRRLLRAQDADIIEADGGNKALQLALTETNVALVLLDVQMPDMDGYEVARLLGEESSTSHIPIIFLTAVATDEHHELEGYESGGVDFIHKPIVPEILLSKITIFLDLWRVNAALKDEVKTRREAEERIRHLAKHDLLTSLPNRSHLQDNIKQGMSRVNRYGGFMSVLFLDLDGFKLVNDVYGHDAGDFVLKEMAGRLKNMMRPTDTVARFGGDEFVIVMTDVNDLESIIPKLQSIISTCSIPIAWMEDELNLGVSLGVANYPNNAKDAAGLIKAADKAMYLAKDAGKNCFRYYMDESSKEEKKYKLISERLEGALERNELYLEYQPIHCTKTLQLVGAEALLRWHSPELGRVDPTTFIPVAESSGIIDRIGGWVIKQALADSIAWWDATSQRVRVMVNISTAQISEDGFSGKISEFLSPVLATVGKSVSIGDLNEFIGLEIKEKILGKPFESVNDQLKNINKYGFGISIDNVGADVSALNCFKNSSVTEVKIDRCVIDGVDTDDGQAKIARSIIAMAHIFGLKVIATGIETQQQFDFLAKHDCDYVQGFYLSESVGKEAFKEYILAGQNQLLENIIP